MAPVLLAILCSASLAASDLPVGGIDVYADGETVHLLVGRRAAAGGTPTLEYLRSDDGGVHWSSAVAVAAGLPAPYRVEAGDFQLAARGQRALAVWTTKGSGPWGSGPLAAAESADGRAWRRVPAPGEDRSDHGRRFADLSVDEAGTFHAVWLDRKSLAQVLYARSADPSKGWSEPRVLDPDACECCWNTIVSAGANVRVLYRDRDPRDMALLSSSDGGTRWAEPRRLGGFDWRANACPHAGGGLALSGRGAHAVVWNGDPARAGLYHLGTVDGNAWSAPAKLGDAAAKHADVAASGAGLIAVWDSSHGGRSTVFAAVSRDGGKTWGRAAEVSPPGASAGYPRVVATSAGFRAFWTEKRGATAAWASAALR